MGLNDKLKRKFRRLYNADLLTVSMNSIKLGDIVEWDGFLKNRLDFENISLIDNLKLDSDKKLSLKRRLADVLPEKSAMQNVMIDGSFDFKAGVDIPNFATGIGLGLGFDRFLNIKIDEVLSKVLASDLKIEIRDLISKAKEEDKKFYRKKLKHLYYIDKLFYAESASFELKNTSKIEIEAKLTELKIVNPKVDLNASGNIKVTLACKPEIPFAADIDPLSDLID